MIIFRKALAVLSIVVISVSAHAEGEGGYWGVGLSAMQAEDEVGDSIKPTNVYGHLGYDFNQHFGVEGQSSFTLLDDSLGGADWSAMVLGVYAKGAVPVSDRIKLYLLGGFSSVEMTADFGFGTGSDDESGASYGVGADFAINDDMDVFVRYMNYLEEDGLFSEVTGLNIGVGWSF